MIGFYALQLIAQVENPALGSGISGYSGVEFFQNLLPALIGIALAIGAIIFLFMLLIGGIQYITSGGDKAASEAARGRITNAVIGIVIMLSIFVLIRIVELFFGTNLLRIDFGPLQIGGSSGGGSGCFLAGTKIKMADGSFVEIQEVKEGDVVYSYDLEKGALVKDEVKNLIVHNNYEGGHLTVNHNLNVTVNHNFWITNRSSWDRADSLKIGDSLLNSSGEEILISSIDNIPGTNTVYNLHLNGKNHNYFAEEFLVHNAVKQ